ncbi:MAG: M48 family metallopeptidase [Dehalococcoidia bacterium]|nr:M48 family metallopeptidase [Dehalococcoidia bacterium]
MWEQIRANQIRSGFIMVAMGLLLVALGYVLGYYFVGSGEGGILFALVVWGIMNLVALFQGDSILLSLGNARKVTKVEFPRLYNVVEEMTIASGLPRMPDVYIIDDSAPNAFATGRKPENASVAVTTGLLQKLNRDELQGVVAHEMGHIKNRDTMLMAIGGILLGTIVLLAYYASRFLFYGGVSSGRRSNRNSSGGAGQAIILTVGLVLLVLAPIAARLLYFALSRKREYLADASSALYTRYPEGLASALEKIAATPVQLKSANQATAPMYIVNPFRKAGQAFANLSSTHPPTVDRVRVLRTMGGASFYDYDLAFRSVRGKRGGVIPHGSLAAVGEVPLRAPSAELLPDTDLEVRQAREVSGALWQANNYRTVDCPCGVRMRVPPGVEATHVKCPRCGATHNL